MVGIAKLVVIFLGVVHLATDRPEPFRFQQLVSAKEEATPLAFA